MPHSGATILGSALGELDGFFCAGELCFLAQTLRDGRCGCGRAVAECPIWNDVIDGIDVDRLEPDERHYRARSLPAAALGSAIGRRRALTDAYVEALGDLYARVQQMSGCRVLVDTSHSPTYAYLLGTVPGVELFLVHLVRDPVATAVSWQRSTEGCDDPLFLLGAIWSAWNALTPLAGRSSAGYCRVQYEEFVENPQSVVKRLATFVGEQPDRLPFASEKELTLGPNHCVFGNRNRLRTGLVPVAPDDSWRAHSRDAVYLINDVVSWPVRRRFGYGGLPGTGRSGRLPSRSRRRSLPARERDE